MKNKYFGYLIIGIALLIGFIVFSFNQALTKIISTSCSHGPTCPMWGTINLQTNISIGIIIFIILVGLAFIIFAKDETVIKKIVKPQIKNKKVEKSNYQDIIKELDSDEKNIFEKVIESNGTIFQSELTEKTNLNKVKITRILDRLEGKGLIERKRRGMTNVIVLKS
ncbi:MAG: MarR family transcriptional regulator [Candidatus Woesearchaeota archaeon]|nr:MarR family transcriptional regulator [Candidatus Woesearchaeota archaeon]